MSDLTRDCSLWNTKQCGLLLQGLLADGPIEHHPAMSASQVFPVAENTKFLKMTATQFARHDFYSCALNPRASNAAFNASSEG